MAAEESRLLAQCRQEQEEELAGLAAIFGDSSCACDAMTGELRVRVAPASLQSLGGIQYGKFFSTSQHTALQVTIPDAESSIRLLLRCERPAMYPIRDPPCPTVTAGHLPHDTCDWAQDELLHLFTPGMYEHHPSAYS